MIDLPPDRVELRKCILFLQNGTLLGFLPIELLQFSEARIRG